MSDLDSGTTATTTAAEELLLGALACRSGALQSNPTDGFSLIANPVSGAESNEAAVSLGVYAKIVAAPVAAHVGRAASCRCVCGSVA